MRRVLGTALVVIAAAAMALTHAQAQAQAGDSASSQLKKVEQDWVNAAIAVDTNKVGAVLGDDWVGIGPDGQKQTKAQYLGDIKSGKNKLESFDMGPLTVRTFGKIAIVNGSDTEKSSYDGKDTGGKYAWTDVFVKRGSEWKAVSSQITRVTAP
jgi:ketosteroid isomerase-like protein